MSDLMTIIPPEKFHRGNMMKILKSFENAKSEHPRTSFHLDLSKVIFMDRESFSRVLFISLKRLL